MRKLASVKVIQEVKSIPGADRICSYRVDGWWVVDTVGKYQVGDLAVYCEIDSWIPTELAPFLSKGKEPREFEGIKGERLRTVKLKGCLSQGLLLPLSVCSNIDSLLFEGLDVSFPLNIRKWEMQVPAQLAGQVKGNFPTTIPKTDQERVQNLVKEIQTACIAGVKFELTEKLEGSSMTCYLIDGEFGVCSRNLDLKRDENNTFWAVAIRDGIEEKMRNIGVNLAIQGELIGPGIQGNIYKLSKPEFHVFDVYNVTIGKYLNPAERRNLIGSMELKHVPVICGDKDLGVGSVEEILQWAEDKSRLNVNQEREGIVFKEVNGGMTFKAVSNRYLMNEK